MGNFKLCSPSIVRFVEQLLKHNLSLAHNIDIKRDWAHWVPGYAQSELHIIVKFLSYKTREEIHLIVWQNKGFIWKNKQI